MHEIQWLHMHPADQKEGLVTFEQVSWLCWVSMFEIAICHVTSREKLVMPAKHCNGTAVQVTWQWCNTKQFMYFWSQEIAGKLPDPLLGRHTCKTNDYNAHFYLISGAHCMEFRLLTNSERLWPSAWNNTWVPRWYSEIMTNSFIIYICRSPWICHIIGQP